MATLTKTATGKWKAVIRRKGYPTVAKTWRTKRDAQQWATAVEDEMRRGSFIRRTPSGRTTLSEALDRYLREVVPTKKASAQAGNRSQAEHLRSFLGDYGLAAVTPDLVAAYRDKRLQEDNTGRAIRCVSSSHCCSTSSRWQFASGSWAWWPTLCGRFAGLHRALDGIGD